MELYWAGKDITSYVNITGCVHRDVSGGRCDSLDLELDHASVWYRWGPKEDDEVIFTHNGYSTGKLYMSAIYPQGDTFRVLATSVKQAALRKAWGCFHNTTLRQIVDSCAAECQMEGNLYGIDGNLAYPFLLRNMEGAAAFLNRIGEWEGMNVKAVNGAFRGVSVEYAQKRYAETGLEITSKQDGVVYRRREGMKYTGLIVQTPYARATARDTAAQGNNVLTVTNLPAMNNAQAGRWARGLLLMHNRMAEDIELYTALNTAYSAMTRVEISGGTGMTGQWIADEVLHDFYNKRTTVKLFRVLDTIQ